MSPETIEIEEWEKEARELLAYPKLSLMCPSCGTRITRVQYDDLRRGAFGEMTGPALFPERRSETRRGKVADSTDPKVSAAPADRWQRQTIRCPGRRKKGCAYSPTVRTETLTVAYVRAVRAGKKRFELSV